MVSCTCACVVLVSARQQHTSVEMTSLAAAAATGAAGSAVAQGYQSTA